MTPTSTYVTVPQLAAYAELPEATVLSWLRSGKAAGVIRHDAGWRLTTFDWAEKLGSLSRYAWENRR